MRKPISALRCGKCNDETKMEVVADWVAPNGIDPRMHRFECEKGHETYKVVGEKQAENFALFEAEL